MPAHQSSDAGILAREREAENERELPGQRVEEPGARHRPGRQRQAEDQGADIERGGGRQQQAWHGAVDQREERRHQHQHHVERQDVEIAELMGEQGEPNMRRHRIVEHGGGVVPLEQQRIVELDRGQRQHGDRQHGDQHLRGIKLERAAKQAQHDVARRHGAAAAVRHQPQRPAGQEHEQIGGVRDGEVDQRVFGVDQTGNVVDEDRDQREAAPEVDRIGLTRHRRFRCRFAAPWALCRSASRPVKPALSWVTPEASGR